MNQDVVRNDKKKQSLPEKAGFIGLFITRVAERKFIF
jgi:hypothetical protein